MPEVHPLPAVLLRRTCWGLQAVLVALLEEHLYAGEHEHGSDDMYPAFLVVLTSGLGWAMTHHLVTHLERLGPAAAWVLYCIHGSKLAMLLLPEARSLPLCCASINFKAFDFAGSQDESVGCKCILSHSTMLQPICLSCQCQKYAGIERDRLSAWHVSMQLVPA